MAFQSTSSFMQRLRMTLLITACFFILGMGTLFFASHSTLRGLREINFINRVNNLCTLILEGLNTSDQTLEKVLTGTTTLDVRYVFRESQRMVQANLQKTLKETRDHEKISTLLLTAQTAIEQYEKSANDLFVAFVLMPDSLSTAQKEMIKGQLLVAHQYEMEAKETLRQLQIHLTEHNRALFETVFRDRFIPLIVAAIFSILFFAFVILAGLVHSRHLGRSLASLKAATEAVSRGDLHYQAPIVQNDEFGRLTYEFNHMVGTLLEHQKRLGLVVDRLARLQEITASFSEALTPTQVFDVVFRQGFEALGASSGALATLNEEGTDLIIQRIEGYGSDVSQKWKSINLNDRLPMSDAAREHQSIFIETFKERWERYPHLANMKGAIPDRSGAAFPLIVANEVLGSVAFSFCEEKHFTQEEKDFMLALSRQCAQALHRSRLYEAARVAIQVRDEFLSIASHELKTPLTPLKLQLQSLARQLRKGDMQQISLDQLLHAFDSSDRQVVRLTHLIDDLLDVSRISTGHLKLTLEPVNLAQLVEEVVATYSHQLKELGSTIELKLNPELHGQFDRVRIEQVLINLLTNAAKYAIGKPILVTLERENGFAKLSVKDQGPGILPRDQKRIFERFERVRDRDNVTGLGLGLHISQQIIEGHQGTIVVESQPGFGATFIVRLPLSLTASHLSASDHPNSDNSDSSFSHW